MEKTYLDIIDKVREKYSNTNTVDALESELMEYKELIPEFFSKNGEAKGIRTMYEKLHDENYINRKIMCPDINMACIIYEEYNNGMVKFINDLNTSEDLSELSVKLENAKDTDKVFIESIFGGNQNPEREMTLKEASGNLEVLIEFIPKLSNLADKYKTITESMNSDNETVKNGLSMLYESVGDYCYHTIRNVIDTYYSIMENCTPTVKAEAKKEAYQLF